MYKDYCVQFRMAHSTEFRDRIGIQVRPALLGMSNYGTLLRIHLSGYLAITALISAIHPALVLQDPAQESAFCTG